MNLAQRLLAAGVPIIGTSPESIDLAEDRKQFGKLLEDLKIPQPRGGTATSVEQALAVAEQIGYPVLVRPSYVLGGRAMVIAYDADAVTRYMRQAVEYSQERPVLIDHFLENAIEVDVDALCDSKDVLIAGIMQHIEEAGIHSGDSSCVLPAVDIREGTLETLRAYTRKLALALKVVGLVNLQFAIQRDEQGNDHVYVIEVNPRASRTVPYVSKATGITAGQDRRAADDRPQAARVAAGRARLRQGSRNRRALLREIAGFPVVEVCRRRHRSRPGDEVHRRSNGRGGKFWRSFRQGATLSRPDPPHRRHGVFHRKRSRQAGRRFAWRAATSIWDSRLSPLKARPTCWRAQD